MQARRSHRPLLRRVALTAALAALLAPAGVAEAKRKKTPKKPVVTSVKPMQANIGDTITIYGRNFIKGKSKNTIAFRRDGAKTVFVKGDVATLRLIRVKLPETLAPFLVDGTFTKFRLRVLARRFGKSFTPLRKSPKVGPAPQKPDAGAPAGGGAPATPGASVPTGNDDCDNDKVLNRDEGDDDNDLLDDTLEKDLMTDACAADSDGDGVQDGYEYRSAIDLNDDEYQQPNKSLPFPGARPYPNPLFGEDANYDHDGDGLSLRNEYDLWNYSHATAKTAARTLFPLSYSAGMQYSVHDVCKAPYPAGTPCVGDPNSEGRRYPTLKVEGYERWFGANGFYSWLKNSGYMQVVLGWGTESSPYFTRPQYHILDANLSGAVSDGGYTTPGVDDAVDAEGPEYSRSELYGFAMDRGLYLSDEERDEDADGLSNYDEIAGRMVRTYWEKCYTAEKPFPAYPGQPTHPLSPFNPDSDGDGVRDGADDEDHDDLPNVMEISRIAASGFDDTEDGSPVPEVDEGEETPVPTVGIAGPGFVSCKADKEFPRWKAEGNEWHPGQYGRVNPYNPCLPSTASRTCPRVTEFGDQKPAPFGDDVEHWYSLQ